MASGKIKLVKADDEHIEELDDAVCMLEMPMETGSREYITQEQYNKLLRIRDRLTKVINDLRMAAP